MRATLTFGNATALAPSVSGFSVPGDDGLRLAANDGALGSSDDLVVMVRIGTNLKVSLFNATGHHRHDRGRRRLLPVMSPSPTGPT